MAPFLSSLSHGGLARVNGLGGKPRKLIGDFRFRDQSTGQEFTYGQSSGNFFSDRRFDILGDAGAQAFVTIYVQANNGFTQGRMLMTVGDTFSFRGDSSGNGQSYSAFMRGYRENTSISNSGSEIILLAAARGASTCYGPGNAGFPSGSQGSGNGQPPGSQFGWGGNGGGGGGGQTFGYQSGRGGTGGAYYPGPGATPGNGGFLSAGSGGSPWFQGSGAPGGIGYYGGGGGGGGWAPGRGQGCPGGGGGGSNYAGGIPGAYSVDSVSSGAGGNNQVQFQVVNIEAA